MHRKDNLFFRNQWGSFGCLFFYSETIVQNLRYTKGMTYFLKENLDVLEGNITEAIEKLEEVGGELRTAVTQSSETWHDNFPFENAQQQARLLMQRIDDLERLRKDAIKVEPPKDTSTVAIGHLITVRDIETGLTQTFRIGSYIAFTENTISYASPLGSLFIERPAGQTIKGMVGTRERKFEIIAINK